MTNLRPAILCLQETFIKVNDKNYESNNNHNTGHRSLEGVLILYRNDMPQSKINLNTGLKAIIVKVTLHRTISIFLLYIPPHDTVNEKEPSNILQQLATPYIQF